ncbi:MAG TPA: hypothetical protein VMD28_09655 [Acidimicrobiales bacterium]|nr:hypothetical protein [Acidimicrobiales bacterium]
MSVLQKEIRRNNVDNAVLAAYELLSTSEEAGEHLWLRLKIIAVEDVGMGEPLSPVLINCLHDNYHATSGGERVMMAVHAVRWLAGAKKDRTSSEHTDLVVDLVESGDWVVNVPDYALCVHTRAGQEMGRGLVHWWENGARIDNESETADHRYRDRVIELARRFEAERGAGGPAPSEGSPV